MATFTCKLTKMVHFVSLDFDNSSAEQVARLSVDNIWRLHGMPGKIISDRPYKTGLALLGVAMTRNAWQCPAICNMRNAQQRIAI